MGAKLLVRSEDIPELPEGEFYTPDLVGMRVILKVSFFSLFATTVLYKYMELGSDDFFFP